MSSQAMPPTDRILYPDRQNDQEQHKATYSAFDTSPEASSSRNKAAAAVDPSDPLPAFSDERRYSTSLPKIEGEAGVTAFSSYTSSPYTSPKTAPRPRAGSTMIAVGPIEEITLPPISAAVPVTRRGAVSGASSGPLMPFPPIRPPFEDDEFPSRGPSPTLGKRGSFSMGHSNHVPPGPDVQLPTPVLSGSSERKGGLMSIPGYINGGPPQYHSEGSSEAPRSNTTIGHIRLLEEGYHQYQPVAQRPSMHWSPLKSVLPRTQSDDMVGTPLSIFHSSSSPSINAANHTAIPINRHQFNDEGHRPYSHARAPPQQAFHPHPHSLPQPHPYESQHRASGGGYHYDYNHREGSAMSPGGSNHSIMHNDSSLSPRTKQENFQQDDQNDVDSSANGKRPRSAPRVMSSQPRIFACTQCPARFARNHDLKRHQRGHLSVRPYPCNWCEKSFSRKDALKRHILVKGCGKDGKGGSGKGSGKGKRGRGENGDKRSSHNAESSGGDQDDSQYDIKDEHDDAGSEENQQYTQKRAAPQSYDKMEAYPRDGDMTQQAYSQHIKTEYRDGRYSDALPAFKAPTFGGRSTVMADMAALHGRRPSASVA